MKTDAFAAESHRVEFHAAPAAAEPAHQLALHSRRPTGDDQAEGEITLPGYQRVSLTRGPQSWEVDGRVARNATLVRFPTILSGKAAAAWLSIGMGGRIRRLVALKSPVSLAMNRRVEFEPGDIEIEEMP
jgi:hypothetical protein